MVYIRGGSDLSEGVWARGPLMSARAASVVGGWGRGGMDRALGCLGGVVGWRWGFGGWGGTSVAWNPDQQEVSPHNAVLPHWLAQKRQFVEHGAFFRLKHQGTVARMGASAGTWSISSRAGAGHAARVFSWG